MSYVRLIYALCPIPYINFDYYFSCLHYNPADKSLIKIVSKDKIN